MSIHSPMNLVKIINENLQEPDVKRGPLPDHRHHHRSVRSSSVRRPETVASTQP